MKRHCECLQCLLETSRRQKRTNLENHVSLLSLGHGCCLCLCRCLYCCLCRCRFLVFVFVVVTVFVVEKVKYPTLRITFPHSVLASSPVTKGVKRTVAVSPRGQVVFWGVFNSGCKDGFSYWNASEFGKIGHCWPTSLVIKDKVSHKHLGLDSKMKF